jgi:type VI protein secretion system component Hcp
MKIEDVTGDSKGFHFKGWCDVESMQWGMTSNREKVLDAEGATTSFNELSIEKPLGIDSASIRMLFAKGAVIPTVDLKVMPVATKREVQTKYLDIRLEDVLIRSVVLNGNNQEKASKSISPCYLIESSLSTVLILFVLQEKNCLQLSNLAGIYLQTTSGRADRVT